MTHFQNIYSFFSGLFKLRKMIWQLAQKDFTNKFLGSYLGIIWSFFQPIVSIAVLWVVFSLAFKTGNKDEGFPFILYLTAGMIPFSFFTDAMLNGTTSITSYDYLVKKVVFKVEALPLIRIISSLFVHVGIMVLLIIVFSFYGVISFFAIQIFYYLFCLIAMILGFSLITASLNVFTRDIAQVVSVITQLAFWMTPIFWNPSNIPEKFLWILKLNPVFYSSGV